MRRLLVIGAGRSAAALISYLSKQDIEVWVVDVDQAMVKKYSEQYANVSVRQADMLNESERENLIKDADAVISMLPARFHIHVAKTCIKLNKHLLTASYVDDEVKMLEDEIKEKNLFFLYECGLDPGIDHMSAMMLMDEIKADGGEITSFLSYTGGLMAPESETNPWKYKFTWNPRNVVLAGASGTAQYVLNGVYKNIPHHQLFKRLSKVSIPGFGNFEGYPNRDSLKYRELYDLNDAHTIFRGTLRRPGFSSAWNALVQLGMTDDSYPVRNLENMSFKEFTRSYLPYSTNPVEENFVSYLGLTKDSEEMSKLTWLGIFDERPIGLKKATPAQVVQKLLEEKWAAGPEDKDMIVMQHQISYDLNGEERKRTSWMVTTGEMKTFSGMAKTVGYPIGIAAMNLLDGKTKIRGLHIPIEKEIYTPILKELEGLGVIFSEVDEKLQDKHPAH